MNVTFPNSKGSVCEPSQSQDQVQLKLSALLLLKTKLNIWDFPADPVVKNLPSKVRDAGSVPGLGN